MGQLCFTHFPIKYRTVSEHERHVILPADGEQSGSPLRLALMHAILRLEIDTFSPYSESLQQAAMCLLLNRDIMDSGRNDNMAIPLCLPNNCQWNSATGKYNKTGEGRSSLYVVDEALQKLRTVRGKRVMSSFHYSSFFPVSNHMP